MTGRQCDNTDCDRTTVQKLQEGYEFHLITFAANGGETAACGPWCFA